MRSGPGLAVEAESWSRLCWVSGGHGGLRRPPIALGYKIPPSGRGNAGGCASAFRLCCRSACRSAVHGSPQTAITASNLSGTGDSAGAWTVSGPARLYRGPATAVPVSLPLRVSPNRRHAEDVGQVFRGGKNRILHPGGAPKEFSDPLPGGKRCRSVVEPEPRAHHPPAELYLAGGAQPGDVCSSDRGRIRRRPPGLGHQLSPRGRRRRVLSPTLTEGLRTCAPVADIRQICPAPKSPFRLDEDEFLRAMVAAAKKELARLHPRRQWIGLCKRILSTNQPLPASLGPTFAAECGSRLAAGATSPTVSFCGAGCSCVTDYIGAGHPPQIAPRRWSSRRLLPPRLAGRTPCVKPPCGCILRPEGTPWIASWAPLGRAIELWPRENRCGTHCRPFRRWPTNLNEFPPRAAPAHGR